MSEILFICDRKACGDSCPNSSCRHTSDPGHARHFERDVDGNYWELDVLDWRKKYESAALKQQEERDDL